MDFFQLNTIKKIQNEDSIINSEKYYIKKCDDKFLIVAPKNSGWCLVDADLLPFIKAVEGRSVKIKDIKKYFYGPIHRIHEIINTLYNKNIIGINGEWLFDVHAYDKYREVRLTCLIIKLTRQCNLNCQYCYADAVSENKKLSIT
jgi:sulfatase maturation enzyme AslB (radical SAM superfamily)